MTYRPFSDWIYFVREKPPTKIGLIHVPDSARQKETKSGVVVAVGPGRAYSKTGYVIPMLVQKGDRVLFDPLADLRLIDEKNDLWAGVQYQCAGILDPIRHSVKMTKHYRSGW